MNNNIYDLLNLTENEGESGNTPLSDKEVNILMKRICNENESENRKKITLKNRRLISAIAAVAAVAVIAPASVYAYKQITASIEKTAPYQNTVKIEPVKNEDFKEDSTSVSDEYMTWNLGYVPDGFIFGESNTGHEGKYHNEELNSGITPCFYRIPENMDNFEINLKYSDRCENYESGDNTAMINYRIGYDADDNDPSAFGREVWICFGDTRYVLQLYIGNGVSEEDMYKIIDNASLVPADKICYSENFSWLNESSDNHMTYSDNHETVDLEKCNLVKIGETGEYSSMGCSFKINSAEITDSFNGITTDGCGWDCDFSEYMDENGDILPNTRTWYKFGNGVNRINEDIESYEMPFHILKLKITAVNTADEYQELCICPSLYDIEQNSISLLSENDENIPKGYEDRNNINFRDSLFSQSNKAPFVNREEFFSFNTDSAHMGGKNYVNLEAGETADFEVCFMIADNNVGKPYLTFYCTNSSEIQSLSSGNPLYDLTEVK